MSAAHLASPVCQFSTTVNAEPPPPSTGAAKTVTPRAG